MRPEFPARDKEVPASGLTADFGGDRVSRTGMGGGGGRWGVGAYANWDVGVGGGVWGHTLIVL